MASHIQYEERRSIERSLSSKKSLRTIARRLGRSVSSISEEIRHGSVRGVYRADRAQKKAETRRRGAKQKCLKVALDPELKAYVTKELTDNQSPEAISGRLKHVETRLPYASGKAIYHFVHSPHGGPLEHHLYRKRVKRKGGPKRGSISRQDTAKVSIEMRPSEVEERLVFGDFEGDFIESGRDGTGSLLVLVERKTRYPFLIYTEDRTTAHINQLIETMLSGVPVRSITLDNDLSFARHEELSELVGAIVYFCHPYTSSEKGTVENRNGRIREFIPKRSDISRVGEVRLREIESFLRTRYLKCLGFATPEEAWDTEMEQWRKKNARATVRKNAHRARVLSKRGVRLLG
jgi:transposase, IS30 family